MTWGEIIDDGDTLIEDHVEAHMLSFLALAVYGKLIVVIDNKGGEYREVDQPLLAEHPVVAIATANTDMTESNIDIWGVRTPSF